MFADLDLELLLDCGRRLDETVRSGESMRHMLMRGLLKVRDKRGRLRALVPNRAQREYARRCTGRNIVLKARQLGITTYVAARFFLQTITQSGTLTVQVAHDQQSAEEIFRIVHRFLENLPEEVRAGALITSRANVRQIVFPRLDSEYRVETAADPSAGRGLTIRNLHCSEVARWPRDAAATLASLRAAVPSDGEVVLESTPNGASGCFYEEWRNADESGYTRHFLPWWYERSYVRPATCVLPLDDEEEALVRAERLTYAQIAFRREIRAQFRKLAAAEFAEDPGTCFLASNECLFDLEILDRRINDVPRPVETRDNERLQVYFPPRPGAAYIIGVDPAGGGTDGDYACAEVIDHATGMQCAELYGYLSPQELASRVARLAREYNGALVAVERNNHGHAVLAYLVTTEQYEHVFEQAGQPGWLTTSVSRPRMISSFAALLTSQPELFQSARLLRECRTFVRRKDGSGAAAAGAHDDCVMAMAIALAVREQVGPEARSAAVGMASLPSFI